MERFYSVIVPIYNRPVEMKELLESLCEQTYKKFELLVIEDGSTETCEEYVNQFKDSLDIKYYFKPNSGQGFSRNYGYERANGEYFIVFDSDCLIPSHYFEEVNNSLNDNWLDAFGGPDAAHESFTPIQKAISYSMTSLFTTGGIRGNKKHIGPYHPRSFNMGISRAVWEKTQGYILPKKGEDIEFSIRIIENGFKTGLIENAFVYHKRRTSLGQFYKQLHFFGTARINIYRFFKSELKLVHFFPLAFTLFIFSLPVLALTSGVLLTLGLVVLELFLILNFADSAIKNRSIKVGFLSVFTSFIQLFAYGMGFMKEGLIYLRKG